MAFGGGFFGSGESSSESSQTTEVVTSNLDGGGGERTFQDASSVNIDFGRKSDDNVINLVQTDHNAFQEAADAFDRTIAYADNLSDRSAYLEAQRTLETFEYAGESVQAGFEAAAELNESAFAFGADALREVSDAGMAALRSVESAQAGAFDFGGDIVSDAFDLLGDFAAYTRDSTAQFASNLGEFADRTTAASDARVEGIAEKAIIAGAIVLVAVLGFGMFKKG